MSAAIDRANRVLSQLNMNQVAGESKQKVPTQLVSITARQSGVAVITINHPPVNALHPAVQEGIALAYDEACKDDSIKAVVFTGGNTPFFMAGADLENVAVMQAQKVGKAQVAGGVKNGNTIFNRLESGPKPTVAAINGQALGGGCELAMACNARIAVGTATFGQPELKLGLIPGLGGTQRFPRLIGLQKGIQFTLSGKTLKAAEALKLGLIDAIVKPEELLLAAGKVALDIAAGKKPKRRALFDNSKIGSYEEGKKVIDAARLNAAKKSKNVPHPNAFLNAVEAGLKDGGEAGLTVETDQFAECLVSPSSRALIAFFFATRVSSKVKGVPAKATGKPIKNVAVIGGGTMGAGICIAYLLKGYNVILKEINEKALLAGVERILNDLHRVIKARKLPVMAIEQIMRTLTPQTDYANFDKLDLVIEAVIENIPLKQSIFAELEKRVPAHCILATNTSTIDIEQIGAKTKCQDRILGLHFFAPAHVMPLLEIVRTKLTSPNTIAQSLEMSKKIGKTPIVVGNCVGFTANRAMFPYGQAASFLVDSGVCPYRIDRVLESFGMPMGVFKMADLSGVDIFMHVGGIINSAYGERCYNSTLGKKLFDQNRFGQKTGVGYYKYVKGVANKDENLGALVKAARAEAQGVPDLSKISDSEIIEILLYPVINESLRIVGEGFAERKSDVDLSVVLGYGFPAYRGGVLHYGDAVVGLGKVRERLQYFSSTYGKANPKVAAFFAPSSFLNSSK